MQPVITYFPIRGRVEPIRLMLEELAIPYTSKPVTMAEWPALKPTLPFKVLPVFDIDGMRIVESRAMYRYLARKHNLYGRDAKETVQCDMLEEALRDTLTALMMLYWGKDFEQKAEDFRNNQLVTALSNLEAYLGSYVRHPDYCVGDTLSGVDFMLWFYLDCVRPFAPGALAGYPALTRIKHAVENRPRIKAYLASDRRPATITVALASFGGTPETS